MKEIASIKPIPIVRTVPLVSVRDVVVFPTNEVVLTFSRRKSMTAVNSALGRDKLVALFTQYDPGIENPGIKDLCPIGTLCIVERTLKNDNELNTLVRGISRIKLSQIVSDDNVTMVEVIETPEVLEVTEEVEALVRNLTSELRDAVNLGKAVEFMNFMKLMSGVSASELADQTAATLTISTPEKQKLLEEIDVKKRLYKVNDLLSREIKVLEIEKSIASKTQEKFSKSMRENVLRERIQTIRQELGEIDSTDAEHDEIYYSIKALPIPKKDKEKVMKELDRLDRMSPHNPEYNYIRTWVEGIIELPWGKFTADRVALTVAEKILDEDHYGLEEVKERILEYLAVMKLKRAARPLVDKNQGIALPTILCFVGPPGVGKTSIGKSIARSLHRKFVKISLGGIRDEAEIRGHRKTYVGAMSGRIIEGMKSAGSSNPVFMLDEIDKIGNDFRGDPSAALLEALDPEQNKEFSDHYVEIPYDLSKVMFIATANVLDTIPSALADRLEVIRFSGYTRQEKFHIAKKYLIPKVIEKNGLKPSHFKLVDPVVKAIISEYTREAGVRSLEREIAKIARKIAKKLASKKANGKSVTSENLHEYLGPVKYLPVLAEKTNPIGQVTGLAWTSVGGEILFVEVATMPGSGKLQITGQLGDVMKESAQAAYSYIRSSYKKLGLKEDFHKKIDIHIHVPEGAVPKDGPSAGVTLTTALVSALTHKKVHKDLAMTGEVTLRGNVLEIGGLKEKVIAAHGAGIKAIVIPFANQKDLEKIPAEIKKDLKFYPVKTVDEVLKLALI